jgi:hypothetical protein
VNTALAFAQTVVAGVEIVIDGVMLELTTIVIALLVAVAGEAQAELVRITRTTSPFAIVLLENVELLAPVFAPFTVHWYAGVVPPFVGVAVKVTVLPEQIVVADAVKLTEDVTDGVTEMVIPLLVAVGAVTQVKLVVMTHEITSLATRVEEVYVSPVATTVPFFFHE